jgi:ribosomal peptide maturation radical SAM protein 1
MRFRSKSPARVLEELDELARRSGRLRFLMTDAILDHAYFRDVIPRLADGTRELQIFYETKANLRREQIELLRRAGVVHLQPGIESLDSAILAHMRKGTTALLNIRMLKYCFEHGINTLWNIIYGFPGEDEQAYARMAELTAALTHLQPPSLVPLVLDRFSPYERDPAAFGLEIVGPPFYYPVVFPDAPEVRAQHMSLAYRFEYRHADGRDPERYVTPLRAAVERWQRGFRPERACLRHARGPGFLAITDERIGLPRGSYRLEGWQADAYLACDAGATVDQVARQLAEQRAAAPAAERPAPAPEHEQLAELFGELVACKLLYEEDGRHLSLSVSARRRYPSVLLEA